MVESGRRGAMRFVFRPLAAGEALAISRWHYEGPYAFYDQQSDPDDLAAFLNPRNWPGRYWAVLDGRDALVGYFRFERDGGTIEVGLGLRPDLTGRGLGAAFVQAGLDFARRRYAPERFTLRVATFNRRAIRVYERTGFVSGRVFMQATNGGLYEFVEMARPA